jgi:Phage integrase family
MLEIHLIIRGALNDAVRRGIVTRNVALVAHAPKVRSVPKAEQQAGRPPTCRRFSVRLPATSCFPPCSCSPTLAAEASCSASSGTTSISTPPPSRSTGASSRSATSCTSQEARPATRGGRSTSTPPPSRCCRRGGHGKQPNEPRPGSNRRDGCSPTSTAAQSTPTPSRKRSSGSSPEPASPNDVRHTHGTLFIKAGVPVKVVSERLGHGNPTFTIDTYQHVLPACKPKPPASSES